MTVNVAIVAPILARNDAISRAAIDNWRMINSLPGHSATLLTGSSDYPDIPVKIAGNTFWLLRIAEFQKADVIIYHFGIYSKLFNGIIIGNGKARQIVRFHNVTPAQFLPPEAKVTIERSIAQMYLFNHACEIWADSPTNAAAVSEYAIAHPSVTVLPLLVETPERHYLPEKHSDRIEILFLGRMVKSKGIIDLLDAISQMMARSDRLFRLRLAGNAPFSDPAIVSEIRSRAEATRHCVEFLGEVDDKTRDQLLKEAHLLAIPSYHEGFCKPVVEALRSGCIPVGYDAYNLPHITAGLGRLVPSGNVAALAEAMTEFVAILSGATSEVFLPLNRGPTSIADFAQLTDRHVVTFEWDSVTSGVAERLRHVLDAAPRNRGADDTLISIE